MVIDNFRNNESTCARCGKNSMLTDQDTFWYAIQGALNGVLL